jgi:hypothetical protein
MTRFKVLYGNYVQLTQTAYQKSKSFESNLMWVTGLLSVGLCLGQAKSWQARVRRGNELAPTHLRNRTQSRFSTGSRGCLFSCEAFSHAAP